MSESRARLLSALALFGMCAAWLALLFPHVRWPEPFLNDSVLHFGLIQALGSAPERGQSMLDPWVPTWCMGYPVFHYYQNLPHFAVLLLDWLTPLSTVRAFKVVEWLAIGTLPIPIYLSMRWFRFGRVPALFAAALVLLCRTNYLHGLDFESYVWQGLGQYTQAFGGWFLPLGLAATWRTMRYGRGYGLASVLMTATFLSHLALGYMAFMAAAIAVFTGPPREIGSRILRLAVVSGVTGLAILWVALPIFQDFAWYNVSTLVPSWKYNSFGHGIVLPWLITGELFDFQRSPVLTVLVLGGFLLALARFRRSEPHRLFALAFVLFLMLFFGRPTWGKLLELLPLGSGFHYSRAIYMVHQFGVMLAGSLLAAGVMVLVKNVRATIWIVPLVVAAVLSPLVVDRVDYLGRNAKLVEDAAAGYAEKGDALESFLAEARSDRLGRVFGGLGRPGQGWGGNFMVGWAPVYSWFPQREMDALGYLYHMWSLNADFQDTFNDRDPSHFRAFGVRRGIAPPDYPIPPFGEVIRRDENFVLWGIENDGLVGLVDVPFDVAVSKKNASRVHRTWLKSPLVRTGLHPAVHITEAGPPPPDALLTENFNFRFPPATPPAGEPGEILEAVRTGEDFRVRVRADRDTHVLLRMTYHPGWTARRDGEEVTPTHVMPSYLAVPVGPGEHEVEFAYRGSASRPWIMLLGVLGLLGALVFDRVRRPGPPVPSTPITE